MFTRLSFADAAARQVLHFSKHRRFAHGGFAATRRWILLDVESYWTLDFVTLVLPAKVTGLVLSVTTWLQNSSPIIVLEGTVTLKNP